MSAAGEPFVGYNRRSQNRDVLSSANIMRKIFTIALREYRALVATKAFILSLVMMPILMFGSLILMSVLNRAGGIDDKTIVVADGTNELLETLVAEADAWNERITAQASQQRDKDGEFVEQLSAGTRFHLARAPAPVLTADQLVDLSREIANGELYAVVEIPPDLLSADASDATTNPPAVKFYAQDSALSAARQWVERVINERVRTIRLERENIDPAVVAQASLPVPVQGLGLVLRSATGDVVAGEEADVRTAIFLPLAIMMLMFMVIFLAAQPALESVLEEKSQRIAEVLLGSVSPFQLMAGKLLGTVAGSLTVFLLYFIGAMALAQSKGWSDQIPLNLLPWFVVFQVGGVLFYSAIFLAIGASVNQLKEAQSMLLPVWVTLMSPMFVWFYIIREPNSQLAFWLSMIPPCTPSVMLLRMSTGMTIPTWQPIVGMILVIAATILVIMIAARIFRIGLLWQGKVPKFTDLLRWARLGS